MATSSADEACPEDYNDIRVNKSSTHLHLSKYVSGGKSCKDSRNRILPMLIRFIQISLAEDTGF